MSVAVWGLGRHAINNILPAIRPANGLDLYGVCSRNPATVAECSVTWRCKGWTDPAEMLADADVDVVYVATPIGLHADHGKRVLGEGKHLWCEKPLASTLRNTLELLELSRASALSVCECHMYLHHPQFHQLRAILSAGRLGAILSVDSRFGIPELANPGFRNDRSLGGGALLDVGCYPISAVEALFPEQAKRVLFSRISSRPGSPVDTHGQAVIEISNGAVANLEWRTGAAYRNDLGIWGDTGTLFTDRIFSKPADYVPSFYLCDVTGHDSVESGRPGDHFVTMLENFRQMIGDRGAAESERGRIRGRAELLDQISQKATQ